MNSPAYNQTLIDMRQEYMREYSDLYNQYSQLPVGVQDKYYNEYAFKANKLFTLVEVLDRTLRIQGYYHES